MSAEYYVYVIFDLRGVPRYVGKGKGKRWLQTDLFGCNRHLLGIARKAGMPLPRVKTREGLTDAEARATEVALIAAIGRADLGRGPLVNLTDGGDRMAGWVPSAETRAKIGAAHRGKTVSAEARTAMSIARRGRPKSSDHRQKIGQAHIGMKRSAECCEKMRQAGTRNAAKKAESLRRYYAGMTDEQKAERSARIKAGLAR